MKVIIVTGAVCSGKTTIAKKIAKEKSYKYIDLGRRIKKRKLYDYYDRKRKTYVVDVGKLNKFLINLMKTYKKDKIRGVIIDSHLSHYLDKKYVDLCIVTKCDIKKLKKRLEKRGYNKAKVRENLDCEIFDICLNEAKENKHKILIVDTSKKVNLKEIIKKI